MPHVACMVIGGDKTVKRPETNKYDCRTKKRIRATIEAMDDTQIIVRECSRSIKRDKLIREWSLSGVAHRRHLIAHLDEHIKLVEYELKIIHEVMSKRGLSVWNEDFMKED